jgi:predicted O-methyltransferase YrrM
MKKFWHIYTYIKYLALSRSRYKTHSPFVYDFIEGALKKKGKPADFSKLAAYKKKLFKSKTPVETVDFGSGAGKSAYKTSIVEIGKLAKQRTHSTAQLEDLYGFSNYFKPKTILEMGTATGFSSLYLKKGNPGSRVITMEGCAGLAHIAQKSFALNHIDDIEIVIGNFDNTLPALLNKLESLDMVFFDGNHKLEPTLNYFEQCLRLANDNSVFIFDDIYWSKGMTQAWEKIKNHPETAFTIDLYWAGLVFFKKGFAKQHFIIRY